MPYDPAIGDETVSPGLVLWEAWRERNPAARWWDELSTMEAMRLMNEVRCFGRIAFQLVGRPLRRADLGVLIEHGTRIGLSLRLAPGPDVLAPNRLEQLRDAGLKRIVLASEWRTPAALRAEVMHARAIGLGVHVETEVDGEVLATLETQAAAYSDAGVHVWQLTFGVECPLTGEALDAALERIVGYAADAPLRLEVAGAPQVQRFAARGEELSAQVEGYSLLYIAADGSLQPSAVLPLALGNVRHDDVVEVFRDAWELCALRDPDQLHGKCGACEFRFLCGGGSRARALAFTGDFLAPDPSCEHTPAAME